MLGHVLVHILGLDLEEQRVCICIESKRISNDQELIQSDPTSCPQNQNGKQLNTETDSSLQKALAVNRMNSPFRDRWSFNYLKFTKICH